MKAVVLAAGYGTRLYPLTRNYPKALLKIRDKPIITYLVEKLSCLSRIREIVVITNDKFYPRFKRWARNAGRKFNKKIMVVSDGTKNYSQRLGAIGDLDFVVRKLAINEDILVLGGDNLFEDNLRSFLRASLERNSFVTIGLYDIRNRSRARDYGIVILNRQKRIVDFQEKSSVPRSTLVATCLYYFPRSALGFISNYLKEKSHWDTLGYFISWLCSRVKVYGFKFRGLWFDIGHHYSYAKAKESFKTTE